MNKKIILLTTLSGFVILLIVANIFLNSKQTRSTVQDSTQIQKANYKTITSKDLNEMIANKDFFLVNVHTPYAGEIEKTDANIAYDTIGNNLDKLPVDKNAKIVVYCRSGSMSKTAAETLASLGYTNIYNQVGGMIDWEKQGYTLINK